MMKIKKHEYPMVVIVGETASGKSALAMEIASTYNGEIICADSRTVYRGMDIGTAKPSVLDQKTIRHHVLDVINPNQNFSVADFQRLANVAILDICEREKLPIIVGGTGLYIDSILYDFQFRKKVNPALRTELEKLSVDKLRSRIIESGFDFPENNRNPRHLMRTIETNGELSKRGATRQNTLILGLKVERETLKNRIEIRIEHMIKMGFVVEVKSLIQEYGTSIEALKAPGYRAFMSYLDGEQNIAQASKQFAASDLNLAKRQRTWFRRNKSIHWVDNNNDAKTLVQKFLSNHSLAT